MRVRAFSALAVVAIPAVVSCSDADTASNTAAGGGTAYGTSTGGGTSTTGGGTSVLGTGGAGAGLTTTGGGVGLGTGGAGIGTGGTAVVAHTGGTSTTQNTGGTSTTVGSTGGTDTVSQSTGGTGPIANTGGNESEDESGGSGDTGSTSNTDYAVGEGAFVTTCGWSGFAWTGADALSTIDPEDYDDVAAGTTLCANGSVAAADDWSGYAMLAINIGQATTDASDSADIATDGSGIYVDIENNAGSALRVQIQDSTGGDDPTHRWCAEYTGPGVIPWGDFNTECWTGGEGTAYNGEEINAVVVLVPGDDTDATDFDFCVNKIEPDGSPSCSGGSSDETGGTSGNTGGTSGNTGGTSGNTGGTESSDCTDDPNPEQPDTSCQQWKDWNNCDQSWMIDGHICDRTCGRCDGGSTNTGGSTGNTGGGSNTGGNGYTGETLPLLTSGSNGYATRYWDCCKPGCGWAGKMSSPVDSCDIGDNKTGDDAQSACSGGSAYTCHSMAPWAVSDTLSYGFAAFNELPCGTCVQIRFLGSSSHGSATPAVDGKQMVVEVTNTGGLQSGQFDILIPGGGVGDFNACSTQWGASDLGAQYGGWRSTCGADANCIRGKCQAAFGNDTDLMRGCDWYIDWLKMADNPDIMYQQIACPSALTSVSGG